MADRNTFFVHTEDKDKKIKRFVVVANNRDQVRERVKQSVMVNHDEDIMIYTNVPLIWDHKEAHVLFA